MPDYISVRSEELRLMAAEVGTELSVISGAFDNMISVINGTSGYWEGDGASAFRERINAKRDKMELMVRRIGEYIDDLNTISQVYDTTEQQSAEIAAELETDVIY